MPLYNPEALRGYDKVWPKRVSNKVIQLSLVRYGQTSTLDVTYVHPDVLRVARELGIVRREQIL